MRDAQATRDRIMVAATAEFAAHGIAGARVDRIAAAAQSNKAQLYSYVGNKDALFDAVFEAHVGANVDGVPLTADDLPGYAGRLYDAYLADPALVRLCTWRRLERVPTGDLFTPVGHDEPKLAAIAAAQAAGRLTSDLSPADLWSMVLALAGTWAQASISWTATADEPEPDHVRRRAALERTVRRAFGDEPPVTGR